jgi:hypothetical protein
MLKIALKDWSTLHQFLDIYIILEAVTGRIDFAMKCIRFCGRLGKANPFTEGPRPCNKNLYNRLG